MSHKTVQRFALTTCRSKNLSVARHALEADHLVGVHDTGWIEGALDATHQLHLDGGPDRCQLVTLQLTDTMLCGNRTVMGKHQSMHDMVHLVPAGDEGILIGSNRLRDVVVDVAVAHMAEGTD